MVRLLGPTIFIENTEGGEMLNYAMGMQLVRWEKGHETNDPTSLIN